MLTKRTDIVTMLKSILAVFTLILAVPIQAQSSSEIQARAFYLTAVEAIERGEYSEGLEAVREAELRLGESNAALTALAVRGHFGAGDYVAADEALQRFYAMRPSGKLQAEIAPLIVEIHKRKKVQVATANANLEWQKLSDQLIANCVDGSTCVKAARSLNSKNDSNSRALILKLTARACQNHRYSEACSNISKDESLGKKSRFMAANIGCELATANDCVLASAMLVNRGRFDDSLGGTKSQAVSLAVRGCTLGSPSGCMDAMALYGGAHGFAKDRKLRKKYRDIGCAKAQEDGKFDTTTLMVTCAKERVRWYKEMYGN